MILNQTKLAEFFGKSTMTIRNWEKAGMPYTKKKGMAPVYDTEEILKWLKGDEKEKK